MADESDVKQELGQGDQPVMSQEQADELKPDVDELMRKIEEEKEKRYPTSKGTTLKLVLIVREIENGRDLGSGVARSVQDPAIVRSAPDLVTESEDQGRD